MRFENEERSGFAQDVVMHVLVQLVFVNDTQIHGISQQAYKPNVIPVFSKQTEN